MATANVLVVITTVPQVFALGTVEEQFHFEIVDSSGNTVIAQDSSATAVTFPNVAEGSYTAKAVKNGVTVSAPFVVAKTSETFQVPATITVTLS